MFQVPGSQTFYGHGSGKGKKIMDSKYRLILRKFIFKKTSKIFLYNNIFQIFFYSEFSSLKPCFYSNCHQIGFDIIYRCKFTHGEFLHLHHTWENLFVFVSMMVRSGFCGDQTIWSLSCSSAESFVSGCKTKLVESAAHLF